MLSADAFKITEAELVCRNGKEGAERYFCGICGTGIMYKNAKNLPGLVDIQTVTLDDPEQFPPEVKIQLADQLSWHKTTGELPGFDGFPPQE